MSVQLLRLMVTLKTEKLQVGKGGLPPLSSVGLQRFSFSLRRTNYVQLL